MCFWVFGLFRINFGVVLLFWGCLGLLGFGVCLGRFDVVVIWRGWL